jgi:hypothetical protein
MIPSTEVLKGFILTRVLPPLIGIATTWIVGTHVLALFNFSNNEIANELTELATFAVSYVISFLGAHHALKGTYVPGKASR